ncbi:AMP-binding protein [Streptococcus iniae]
MRDPLKGKEWTYEDLNQRAVNLAHYLLAYGISKGDRVALFCPNDIAYFDLLFACTKIGAVLVPINWRLKPIEIKKILEDCHPKIVFFASNHKDRLEKLVPDSQMVDVDDMEYDLICETKIEKELPFVKVDKYSPAFIMYTSGSTGMPKGVMISHNGMIQNAMNGIVNWNFKMSDRTLVSAPMFHIEPCVVLQFHLF